MTALEWFRLTLLALAAVFLAIAVLALLSASFYLGQANLWLTDPDQARAREADKPWAVRIFESIRRRN